MRKTLATAATAAAFVLAPAGAAMADTATPSPAPSTSVTTTTTKTESDKTGLWGLLGLLGLAGLMPRKRKVEHVEEHRRPVQTGHTTTQRVGTNHDTRVVHGDVDPKDDLTRGNNGNLRNDLRDGDVDGRNDGFRR